MNLPKILSISGSLRQNSHNTAILHTLASLVKERADATVLVLDQVPLYNQDLDTSTPPSGVVALRNAIAAADGLIIASPEYNYGLPGVLKNALDWASRPAGKSVLVNKPVLTLTASPGFVGGARAQAQLNEVLIAVTARLVRRPQTVIASVHQKISDGRLADQASIDFLLAGFDDLLAEIARGATPSVGIR